MHSAAAATALSTSSPKNRRSVFEYAYLVLPFAASYLSTFIVNGSRNFTDHLFILAVLALEFFVIIKAVHVLLRVIYKSNDGRIDDEERVYITVVQFVLWILGVMLPQYLFAFYSDAFTGWTLPMWYEGVSCAGVLLIFVIVFSIYITKTLEVTDLGDGEEDEKEEESKNED
jgi:hypothetical protein